MNSSSLLFLTIWKRLARNKVIICFFLLDLLCFFLWRATLIRFCWESERIRIKFVRFFVKAYVMWRICWQWEQISLVLLSIGVVSKDNQTKFGNIFHFGCWYVLDFRSILFNSLLRFLFFLFLTLFLLNFEVDWWIISKLKLISTCLLLLLDYDIARKIHMLNLTSQRKINLKCLKSIFIGVEPKLMLDVTYLCGRQFDKDNQCLQWAKSCCPESPLPLKKFFIEAFKVIRSIYLQRHHTFRLMKELSLTCHLGPRKYTQNCLKCRLRKHTFFASSSLFQ